MPITGSIYGIPIPRDMPAKFPALEAALAARIREICSNEIQLGDEPANQYD